MTEAMRRAGEPLVERRTVVKGAAWSIPVIAAVAVTPVAAASTECPASPDALQAPGTSATDTARGEGSTVVPVGVKTLRYTIIGGTGGGNGISASPEVVTGTIAVRAGDVLNYIAGQGGYFSDSLKTGTVSQQGVAGGQGYGNGGSTFYDPQDPAYAVAGGSGGGGSAIILNGVPVAIAAGGGGAGHYIWRDDAPWEFTTYNSASRFWTIEDKAVNRLFRIADARDASGTSAGVGGSLSVAAASGPGLALQGSFPGWNGSAASLSGSDGAEGVPTYVPSYESVTRNYDIASAGGGGGYASGGSGGVSYATFDAISGRTKMSIVGGGDGGRASSYFNTSLSPDAVVSNLGNQGVFEKRIPGSVTIEYLC